MICPLVAGFTLVEVMISAAIFVVALTGIFLAYGQAVRMLDSLRQTSRSEDILLANVEFLRTRTWTQITNVITTTAGSTPFTENTSNLTESVQAVSTNSPVCSHLTLLPADPLKIGLKGAVRDVKMDPYPGTATTEAMRKATVTLTWNTLQGRAITNTMTVYITMGGMSADIF